MNQLKGPSCPAQTGLGLPDFTKPQAATATQSGVGMACLCAIPKLDRWGTLAQDSRCHSYNHVTFSRVGPPFIPPFVGGLHRVTLPPLFICSEALPQMLQLPVAPIRTWRRHPGTQGQRTATRVRHCFTPGSTNYCVGAPSCAVHNLRSCTRWPRHALSPPCWQAPTGVT